jgi:hypothetical protein
MSHKQTTILQPHENGKRLLVYFRTDSALVLSEFFKEDAGAKQPIPRA